MPENGNEFEEKRINVVAFTNAMRRIYELNPSMTALGGILGVLVELTGKIAEVREGIEAASLNHMLARQWDGQIVSLRGDLISIMEDVGTHPDKSDIPISQLRDNIAGALLYGRHRPYWDPDPWFRHMALVTWAASMWNQLLAIARLDAELYRSLPPGWFITAEALLEMEKQLSASAPGEDPTLRDKVVETAKEIAEGAKEAFTGLLDIGKKALPWFALGIGVVLAVVIVRTRMKTRALRVTVKGAGR